MAAPKIRADYEALKQIAQVFSQQAEATRRSLQVIQRAEGVLESGDWVGQGATAFYHEMDSTVLPAMNRLVAALESANQVGGRISQRMKQAEDDAAQVFRTGLSGGAATGVLHSNGADGAAVGGANGGDVQSGRARASGPTSQGSASSSGVGRGTSSTGFGGNPLLVRDPYDLFTDENLSRLVGSHVPGEGRHELRLAMDELAAHPEGPGVELTLQQIAAARGRPYQAIQADYEKYLQVRAQALTNGKVPPPPINAWLHPDFMGSIAQLRSGKVVGQAFGIDPVFGALLNPTGGMTGPGNVAHDPGKYGAVGYHGEVHDAAGYLLNYHNTGPGYNYLGLESGDPANPLTGQVSGLSYWNKKIPPGRDVPKGVRPHDALLKW